MNDRHPALRYVAPMFRVSDLARSIRFSRDQAAFERAEHLDACAVISAARKLAKEFSAAGAPLSVPLRTMPYGIERWLSMASAAATFSGPQFYDEYLGPAWFEAHAAELARRIPRDPPGDVLELACGTGLLTRHAREKFRDRKDVEWHEADASRLPFADAAFGAVICGFGVMFFPDRVAALREARRVLTEKGLLLFNVWDRIEHHLPAAVNAKVMRSLIPKEAPGFEVPFQMHDAEGLRNLLKATGFEEVRIEAKRFPIKDADPRKIAIGQVRGTHRSALIEKAGVPLESAIDKVAQALENAGGNPYNGYTTAVYIKARAR